MLQVFRDNLKYLSWVLWGVILVFVLFSFTDFGTQQFTPGAPANTAATVGDLDVSYREFQDAYQRAERRYREDFGDQFSTELANQLGLPLQVLNGLVDQRILQQEADRIGLVVTDRELQKAILEIPVFQEDGVFVGQDAYRNILASNRMRPEEFEGMLRRDLVTDKVRAALTGSVYVSPEEVEEAFREEAETATIRFVRLPSSRFAAEVEVDDSALADYFSASGDAYRLPERRVVDYLMVSPTGLADQVTVSDEEVRTYYEDNLALFEREEQVRARHILVRTGADRTVEQAKEQAATIRGRIEAGEDFAALAAELSDDPGSKDKGGDLGFFGRGAMVKPFEDAAFAAELGDLVGPVESTHGVHLIQVQAKRPGGAQPLDEVETGIRARLVDERSRELAASSARELAAAIGSEIGDTAALEALAADRPGTTLVSTPPFSRDDNVQGIGRATDFSSRAFEQPIGELSEPIEVARGWALAVVRKIQPPRMPELDEVRQRVTTDYRRERQLEIARERLAAALAAEGSDLDSVAATFEVTPEEAGPFGAEGTVGPLGRAAEVARRALQLETGDLSEAIVRDNEVVAFEVTERTHFDPVAFERDKDTLRTRLENQRAGEVLQSFLNRRREELDVTFDPQVLAAFGPDSGSAS